MIGTGVFSCVLLLMVAVTGIQSENGYVMCPTPTMSPHGGFNVTVPPPPNQPLYSNGTGIRYFCDRHFQFITFTVYPVTCTAQGEWKLYGMNPNCYATNCTKPLLSKGSGVTIVGTNYTQGAMIRYECKTGWTTLEPTAICLGPDWSNKYNPWCKVATCIPLTIGTNSSGIPYGTVTVTKLGEYDEYTPGSQWRNHQYGADVRYTCQAGTEMLGAENRTCNASGMWSGNMPLCFVQNHICYANTPCSDGKVCCEWGGVGALGLNCCLPPTKAYISQRFAGLTRQCFRDLNDNYLPCMTQIIKCLDNTEETSCISNFIIKDYLYGCNSNLGDHVPQNRAYSYTDNDLVEFCERDRRTVACTEFQSDFQGSPFTRKSRMCLPLTCANQSAADLQALAESTLKLRCRTQRQVNKAPYCSISAVTLNCSNGLQATAHHYDGACEQCPPPGGDQRLTQCCNFNGKNISCCLPAVKAIATDRESANTSQPCQSSFLGGLTPCMGIIADCLNSLKDFKVNFICPSYHACSASSQRSYRCPEYHQGYNRSLWCYTSCTYLDDRHRYCDTDSFCLSQACNGSDDIQQLVDSDAKLLCDYEHLTSGACGGVKVTWSCAESSNRHLGVIIGCSVGGAILLIVVAVVIVKYLVLPKRRHKSYVHPSGKTGNMMKEQLIDNEPDQVEVRMTAISPHRS